MAWHAWALSSADPCTHTLITAHALALLQVLYQYTTQQMLSGCSRGEAKALRAGTSGAPLLMELQAGPSFDAEQIWTQMEMTADVTLKRIRRLVAKVAPQGGETMRAQP